MWSAEGILFTSHRTTGVNRAAKPDKRRSEISSVSFLAQIFFGLQKQKMARLQRFEGEKGSTLLLVLLVLLRNAMTTAFALFPLLL